MPPERIDVSALIGSDLVEHAAGRRVFEDVTARLRRPTGDGRFIVDLTGLRQVGYLALVELLALQDTVRAAEMEERYLIYRVDPDQHELLELLGVALRSRRMALPLVDTAGAHRVLGRLTRSERDTLEFVLRRKEVTSVELGDQFALESSAASNRLRRLYSLRLVRREERVPSGQGGREFVYRPLVPLEQPGQGGGRQH